jgi:hypothetical protein
LEPPVDSLRDVGRDPDRDVTSLPSVRSVITDHEDARFLLEKIPDRVIAQVPKLRDLSHAVMPHGKVWRVFFDAGIRWTRHQCDLGCALQKRFILAKGR